MTRVGRRSQLAELCERAMPARVAYEAMLAEDVASGRTTAPGYCRVCERGVHFALTPSEGGPNYRESLTCPHCQLVNRQRFIAAQALEEAEERGRRATVYAYEQRSAFFRALDVRLGDRLVGSEYVGPGIEPGSLVDGTRHEDATALSFADSSFDVLVSNDVFEHVPDISLTFEEASRVLRHGGILLFSIPFHDMDRTETRARLDGGAVVHLAEPEYHGDPMRPEGALVFYRFGWDLLDVVRRAGFAKSHMLAYYDPLFGHIGGGLQLAFAAVK